MATATGSDYPNGCEYLQEIVLSSCIWYLREEHSRDTQRHQSLGFNDLWQY
jgi:hypothetical protein